MFFLKSLYCRTFQAAFRMAMPVLPYREPEIIVSCTKLGDVLKKENAHKVIIVTDRGIISNGLLSPVENALNENSFPYVIYDGTLPNPTVTNVEDALKIYRDNSCDAIIAIGGGSAMDCAKAVGARVTYPKRSVNQLGGKLKAWRKLPTFIAIPTTAGTGSETPLASMITDSDTHRKYAIMSFPLIPHYAVLDASLTYSLPPHLTATTGMDALTHAVEAYIGRSTTKETRRLALEAVKLIFENIYTAYSDGHNHSARENMLHAAYKAGIAFSKSYVGYIHALAHALGGLYGTPHGLANTVIMPYVLEEYGESAHKKLYELGVYAGICNESDSHKAGAEKFIYAIKKLNTDMGISDKIEGIKKEDILYLSKHAEKEANPLYPVPKLMTRVELEQFYYKISDWSK
jgi:alcohol dehydrogenase class IV